MRLTVRRRAWCTPGAASAFVLVLAAGCRDSSACEVARPPRSTSVAVGGAAVSLDSALTLFRIGIEPIAELEHGEPSAERAVARMVRGVQRNDTADLRALVMSRREFAYLYYPSSPFTRAPTKQEPALAWFLHLQRSQKGVTRLLERYGGTRLRFVRSECKQPARAEGPNRLWDDCVQRVLLGTDTVATRLFGGIYERNGRFKIFSYSNDL